MVQVGNDIILFDVGPGSCHRMLEAGVEPQQITHVFFTHLHYDHCVDYPCLVLTHWDHGSAKVPELKVYGPPPIRRMTEQLFSRDGAFGPDLKARTENPASIDLYVSRGGRPPRRWPAPEVVEIGPTATVHGNGWKITSAPVPHFQPQLDCYAYRLDTSEGSFVFSGDAAHCKELVDLARDCDVLLHMCHLISGTAISENQAKAGSGHLDAARTAHLSGAKTLVFTHMARQMDVPGVPERLLRDVGEIYSGNLIWGEDLMEIPLNGPRPARLD